VKVVSEHLPIPPTVAIDNDGIVIVERERQRGILLINAQNPKNLLIAN
jgi:hypothetical protein